MSTFYNKKGKKKKNVDDLSGWTTIFKIDDLQRGVNNPENVVNKVAAKKSRNFGITHILVNLNRI